MSHGKGILFSHSLTVFSCCALDLKTHSWFTPAILYPLTCISPFFLFTLYHFSFLITPYPLLPCFPFSFHFLLSPTSLFLLFHSPIFFFEIGLSYVAQADFKFLPPISLPWCVEVRGMHHHAQMLVFSLLLCLRSYKSLLHSRVISHSKRRKLRAFSHTAYGKDVYCVT